MSTPEIQMTILHFSVASANGHKAVEMELQKFHGLSEQILTEDFSSTRYSPRSPSRARDLKSHHAQYSYSNRNSICSSENSIHVDSHRRTRDQGVSNTSHSSREILNLAEVRAPSEPKNLSSSRTSLIQSRVISNLNAQAREIAGGQPDYV